MIKSAWTTKYLDIKYVPGGRRASGCDCWGLVCLVYSQELGIELPSLAGSDTSHETNFKRVWQPIAEFDLAFFDAWPSRSHIGIILNPSIWMLHTTEGGRVHATRTTNRARQPDYYRWLQK